MKKWSWDNTTSEDELRSIEDEMRSELYSMDYDSDEHTRLHEEHSDLVAEINSRFPVNLPKREHGWYLSNDD